MSTLTSAAQKTAPHAHHAIQLTVGLDGDFTFEGDDRVVRGPAVAIAPDTRHTFELRGTAAHVFFEPDGRLGRAAQAALFAQGNVVTVRDSLVGELRSSLAKARLSDAALVELGRAFVTRLSGQATPAPTDFRVQKMISWAESRLSESIELKEVAGTVGLSPGRARHVFVEQTGLPFRVFLLWRRLNRAVQLYAARKPLTEAAYAAGFSDAAHLSRTFRRMFGVPAADLWLR
ncbi:MAG: helix-turn-helix domain-containing protein [Archangium sp.]|nr:helix-turn-helix domain-containing protein [Archangium sp.]